MNTPNRSAPGSIQHQCMQRRCVVCAYVRARMRACVRVDPSVCALCRRGPVGDNVLLTEDLRAKLTDFGTARECPELLTGDIVRDEPRGKWHYMVRARVRVGAGTRVGGGGLGQEGPLWESAERRSAVCDDACRPFIFAPSLKSKAFSLTSNTELEIRRGAIECQPTLLLRKFLDPIPPSILSVPRRRRCGTKASGAAGLTCTPWGTGPFPLHPTIPYRPSHFFGPHSNHMNVILPVLANTANFFGG